MKKVVSHKSQRPIHTIVLVIFLLFIPFICFTMGFLIHKTLYSQDVIVNTENQKPVCQSENERLESCFRQNVILKENNPRGEFIDSTTYPFTVNNFGFFSPLFENQNVGVRIYSYLNDTIFEKTLGLPEKKAEVIVWEYQTKNITEKQVDSMNFPIFTGYENYLLRPSYVEELILESKGDQYFTQNNIQMFYSYEYTPKSIGFVCLNSYFEPSWKKEFLNLTFLRVCTSDITGTPSERTDPEVENAKKVLEEIADTLSWEESKEPTQQQN